MNSNVILSPEELKKMLIGMKVNEDEMNNMRCKKLLLYFLLDQILFSTSSSTPRSFLWQMVEDLDQIESYNWPQSILDWTHSELARVKYAKSDGSRTFGSPAPLLEAMLYERFLLNVE
ncbi:hypothetical protein RND81_08G146800 [Saponaria officinalis]|uniref:Phospholipase-like protein n=1 Tax=Saponaria officinalis TaxID=3572 RepID=A0AAW1J8G0_SAPOF